MIFSHGRKTPDWAGTLQKLGDYLEKSVLVEGGPDKGELRDTAQRLSINLSRDLQSLKGKAPFLAATGVDEDELTQRNIDLMRSWHQSGEVPSLAALCIHALERFKIELAPDIQQAVLSAAILGEAPHELPYHNTMHFRKVLLQILRLVGEHNEIYEGTSRAFDDNRVALMMIAACVHDFLHDGKGNTIRGVFEPGRLERQSFYMAAPYLAAAGLPQVYFDSLKVMLLCTDVSPLGDPTNMLNQMKTAYRFHFLGQRDLAGPLNLDLEISALEHDPGLVMMSLLLHEADIATSAGLSYDVTKYETVLYRREIGEKYARPSHIVDFLNLVCQRRMLSDAGQKLYAANMARIYALAEQDSSDGNVSFAGDDLPVFPGVTSQNEHSKTVN